MARATGTFEITGMHEDPWHQRDGEPRLTRAGGTQRFHGDIEGTGPSNGSPAIGTAARGSSACNASRRRLADEAAPS